MRQSLYPLGLERGVRFRRGGGGVRGGVVLRFSSGKGARLSAKMRSTCVASRRLSISSQSSVRDSSAALQNQTTQVEPPRCLALISPKTLPDEAAIHFFSWSWQSFLKLFLGCGVVCGVASLQGFEASFLFGSCVGHRLECLEIGFVAIVNTGHLIWGPSSTHPRHKLAPTRRRRKALADHGPGSHPCRNGLPRRSCSRPPGWRRSLKRAWTVGGFEPLALVTPKTRHMTVAPQKALRCQKATKGVGTLNLWAPEGRGLGFGP